MVQIKTFLLITVCAFLGSTVNVFAQHTFPKFNHLTRDNGLPSNRVNYITEDKQGFIWFGTEDGLSKFDGYNFEVYRNFQGDPGSISDNAIDFILEDLNFNNLWLATRNGLVFFDRVHQKFELVAGHELEDTATGNINITSLCYDNSNNLWIGTFNGLFILNPQTKQLVHLNSKKNANATNLKELRILSLYKDNNNEMWVGYQEGLLKFNAIDSSFIEYFKDLNIRTVRLITQDSKNSYWVGTDKSGLYYIHEHPDKGITRIFNSNNGDFIVNRIHGFIEDEPGKYYILARDGGLYYYDEALDKMSFFEHDIYNLNSINSPALISGYKSSNGIIWLGTYNSGVNYIDKAAKKFLHYKVNFKENGMFNNNIRALLEDSDKNLWIGTKEGGGLSKYDLKLDKVTNYKKTTKKGGLNDDYIFALCEANRNEILVGTFRSGMALFNKSSEIFTYFTNQPNNPKSLSDNRVYSIYKDIQGLIWVGNYTNLQRFDLAGKKFTTVNGIERPRCFLDEDEDRLWIGSKEHGLYLYNKISGKNINYLHDPTNMKSISSNDIYALKKDGQGNLWIATKQGINKLNTKTGEFIRYTESNGLAANWICALLLDEDENVWVSSTNGISKFDVKNNEFHNYDAKDGLQGNEFEGYVAVKTSNGKMLFGGRNGFNMFTPSEITDNTKKPSIVLTGFKLYNKDLPVGTNNSQLEKHISFTDQLVLKHYQSAITIEFVALNYTSPEKNQYAYKLEGFDADWVNAGTRRSAVYTNVPPGKYTFRVIGSNNDNFWNNEGATLNITIRNPYWKTLWAYIVYVLILVVLFYFIRKILESRIKQQNMLNFERLDKKRIQEMNQLKLRFFTNISHEFRTPLTLISGPLGKLMSYKNDNDEQKYLYKIMQNNVQRLLALVNELMDFRKAEHGQLKLHIAQADIVVFIQQIVDCFEETALDKNIRFTFDYKMDSAIQPWFDKNVIDKVIFNLLSNAFKHTPQKGWVNIALCIEADNVVIKVSDSGKGIPNEKINFIFERFYQVDDKNQNGTQGTGIGLAFSKRLIELHHGFISVESEINNGATFTVSFPGNKSHYNEHDIVKGKLDKQVIIDSEPVQEAHANTKLTRKPSRSERLLIVEDNTELREFLQNSFGHFEILTAENGKEGYAIANTKIPDIVISDIMMPEMNGLEMCKKIKTHFATSHIPVVLLTAKTEMSQKIEGIETGADAYVEKPFDINYLEARINNLLIQRNTLRKRYTNETDVDVNELATNIHEKKFIEKTKHIIEANISNPDFSVESFGFELGLSRSQLFRKFKSSFELRPSEYIRNERLKYSKKLLLEGNYNVNEISDLVGFKSASYYITSFKKLYGKTPFEFVSKK